MQEAKKSTDALFFHISVYSFAICTCQRFSESNVRRFFSTHSV